MSTPYMSGFQVQMLLVSAMSAARYGVPRMGRLRFTARRGMPRIRWMPNLRPMAWTSAASGAKPRPSALDGKRFTAGISRPWPSIAGSGLAA
jgi:hypothetical protein